MAEVAADGNWTREVCGDSGNDAVTTGKPRD